MRGAYGHDDFQRFMLTNNADLILLKGNIVDWEGDAIVNAADEAMLGGQGVDGAIHRAAGPELLQACMAVNEIQPGVRCPTGEARMTEGFRLSAKYVIHTVGPIYKNDAESAPKLTSAYRSCMEVANKKGLNRIAFPALSCGAFGYPSTKAAEISLRTVAEYAGLIEEVYFVLFNRPMWKAYVSAAESMFRKSRLEDG